MIRLASYAISKSIYADVSLSLVAERPPTSLELRFGKPPPIDWS